MEFVSVNKPLSHTATVLVLVLGALNSGCSMNLFGSKSKPEANVASTNNGKFEEMEKLGTLNPVTKAAQGKGITTCLERINQVTNFLTTGNQQSGATLSIPPQGANEKMISASFEIQTPQVLSYASADFAPMGENTCGGTYEAVVYWSNSCEQVANQAFTEFKRIGPIKKDIYTLQAASPQLRVFLMPAGNGCVSIKKEIVY